eukprot:CAMPEP_0119415758 /NCGR_PEP_ID=MMETSP1335-20130426/10444_1 /TAXON_ID=259385 /ORGANISM="Chrysoculter rhomboideus, Strain RCC1486" /LENGTH=361 /DNA_ID=CAMNT_0007440799 /DNA_START=77 /DNA_END=1159 /DNA_ORIENTATION=-
MMRRGSILRPYQVGCIAQPPWRHFVLDEERERKGQADRADDDVRPAEERVLSADPRGGGEHDILVTTEGVHRVQEALGLVGPLVDEPIAVVLLPAVGDLELVRAGGQRLVDAAVELAEGGEAGGAHPHDEVLVLHALARASAAVHPRERREVVAGLVRVVELVGHVRRPRDPALAQVHLGAVGLVQFEGVVEEGPRDQPTRVDGVTNRVVAIRVELGARRAVCERTVGGSQPGLAAQLAVRARLDVSPVVLVEVLEHVIHVNGRLHPRRDLHGDPARVEVDPILVVHTAILLAACLVVWRALHLDQLIRGVKANEPNGDKDDPDHCERADHPQRCQDGAPRFEGLLPERRVRRTPRLPCST